ncbi:hypothetical protein HAX54_007649 [Datura stramonium]|uniref:Uncharacterized protein n=1 Tax=Datura stramonium TaxID=4076 RepID=A0ABS8TC70_DATST|nr:hypothetical protein [Datura stramonium]
MHRRFAEIYRRSTALPSFPSICAQFTASQPVTYQRFTNWIGDSSVTNRLGAKASGSLCLIGDPSVVHGYASAFCW